MKLWSEDEIKWLKDNYPTKGLSFCAQKLQRPAPSIRMKAYRLNLKQDQSSDFFKDWQKRAASSKVGKKRPEHSTAIKNAYKQGRYPKLSAETRKLIGEANKNHIKKNGHPRGYLGKKHSTETRKKLSEKAKAMWDDENSYVNSKEYRQHLSDRQHKHQLKNKGGYSRTKSGKRKDLNNVFFRSSWEANYARYLNFLIEQGQVVKWEYEPDTFIFHEIETGTRSYTPDFKIWEPNKKPYYIEVKGWMCPKSKTKLKRMSKYYPEIKITLVQQKEYIQIKRKLSKLIVGWE